MSVSFFALIVGAAALGIFMLPNSSKAADRTDILPDESLKGLKTASLSGRGCTEAQAAVACGRREEDPDLHGGGGGREWLRYDKEIGDFVLQVEWRFIPKTEEPKQYKNAIGVRLSKFGELWVKAQTGGYLFPTGSNSGAGQAIRPPVFAAPSFWSRLVSIASLGALRIPG